MDHDLEPASGADHPQDARRRGWAGWFISAVFHGALIAICAAVYWLIETEPPPPLYPDFGPQPPEVVAKPTKPSADPQAHGVPEFGEAVASDTYLPADLFTIDDAAADATSTADDSAVSTDSVDPISIGLPAT